jgi:hypothetical protein
VVLDIVRHIIELATMRPLTTVAVAVAVVLYIRFMAEGPHTR